MINPTFCDTITLYHRDKSTNQWSGQVFRECYFGNEESSSTSGVNLKKGNTYIVRIPTVTSRVVKVQTGDVIVKGYVTDDIADVQGQRVSDLLAKYRPYCFTVSGIKYNTKIKFGAHIKVTGE